MVNKSRLKFPQSPCRKWSYSIAAYLSHSRIVSLVLRQFGLNNVREFAITLIQTTSSKSKRKTVCAARKFQVIQFKRIPSWISILVIKGNQWNLRGKLGSMKHFQVGDFLLSKFYRCSATLLIFRALSFRIMYKLLDDMIHLEDESVMGISKKRAKG